MLSLTEKVPPNEWPIHLALTENYDFVYLTYSQLKPFQTPPDPYLHKFSFRFRKKCRLYISDQVEKLKRELEGKREPEVA